MIEARNLTKRYGATVAVDDLSFDVKPGLVTGFLGPNGAGKTTTMRMILGLDHPNSGQVTVDGRQYRDLPAPLHEVGALLDAKAVHGGRSAYNHLLCLAQSNGIPRKRVNEVLAIVGLDGVANRRAGGYSLGMGQRLGIAAALLGDPAVLMFDEPVNGLDPEGIVWVRTLMRALAAEGRTVLVSSHLMSEMALTADHLIVIGKGRLIRDEGVNDFVASSSRQSGAGAITPGGRPAVHLRDAGATVRALTDDLLEVSGLDAAAIGELAAAHGRRAARADASESVARGGVHGTHQRQRRVSTPRGRWPDEHRRSRRARPRPLTPACATGGRRSATPFAPSGQSSGPSVPPIGHSSSPPSSGIGLGAVFSAVAANHYATDPGIRVGFNPTDHSLAEPPHRPTGLRHSRRDGRDGRVLDRHDPDQPGRRPETDADDGGQGVGVDRGCAGGG